MRTGTGTSVGIGANLPMWMMKRLRTRVSVDALRPSNFKVVSRPSGC